MGKRRLVRCPVLDSTAVRVKDEIGPLWGAVVRGVDARVRIPNAGRVVDAERVSLVTRVSDKRPVRLEAAP